MEEEKETLMGDHPNTHKKKLTGGDAPAIPPAEIFRKAKEKSVKRNPIKRGAPTKNPSAEEILRAKKKSVARKK